MHPWWLIAPQTQFKSLFSILSIDDTLFSLSARCKFFVHWTGFACSKNYWTSAECRKKLLQEKWVDSKHLNHAAGTLVHMLMQSCGLYMNCITPADPNRELLFTLHLASYFLAGTNLMASVRMEKMTKCVYNACTDISWSHVDYHHKQARSSVCLPVWRR